jgi:hypothetical protein
MNIQISEKDEPELNDTTCKEKRFLRLILIIYMVKVKKI